MKTLCLVPLTALLVSACSDDSRRVTTLSAATTASIASSNSQSTARRISIDSSQFWFQGVSQDGAFLVGSDARTADLALRDTRSGLIRALTSEGSWAEYRFPQATTVSPDGSTIAYSWSIGAPGYDYALRTIRTDGSSARTLWTSDPSVEYVIPTDWMPDNRRIVSLMYGRDRSVRIATFSATDGAMRVIKSFDWRSPDRVKVSPDGRWLAYDFQTSQGHSAREIILLDLNRNRELKVTSDGRRKSLVGWEQDGNGIYYSTATDNALTLWFVPLRDGRPSAGPSVVRSELWGADVIGLAGTRLFYRVSEDRLVLRAATFDVNTAGVTGLPEVIASGRNFLRTTAWSPDGQTIALVRQGGGSAGGQVELVLRNLASGVERAVPLSFGANIRLETWAADARSIMVQGRVRGQDGRYRISLTDGSARLERLIDRGEQVLSMPGANSELVVLPDPLPGDSARIVRRDIGTGREHIIYRGTRIYGVQLSPNEKSLVGVMEAAATDSAKQQRLVALPSSGGAKRVLFAGSIGPESLNWTPDGQHLLFRSFGPDRDRLLIASLTSGEVRSLLSSKEGVLRPNLSPDGRRVAYWGRTGDRTQELWVMEKMRSSSAPDR